MVLEVEVELVCFCERVEVALGELVHVVGTKSAKCGHLRVPSVGIRDRRGARYISKEAAVKANALK